MAKNGAKAVSTRIPMKLSGNEIEERGRKLAGLEIELAKVEEEKAAKSKEFGDKIKGIKTEIAEVSAVIESGEEEREVKAIIERGNGQVKFLEPKTKSVLYQRAMTAEEAQDELEFV